ncbi:MAG TPA: Tox-REase-5 domain-containing protein [Archangium sp.]|nr:Tox-REase-5 domain-containing protein [Archangium sp.]
MVPPLSGEPEGAAGGFPEQTRDFFQVVQEASGLGEEARHPAGAALYLEQARQLLGRLAKTPVTQRSFAPRRALCWLLREVLEGGERVEYADLKWRAERFGSVVLVRPDGYLVTALDGTPLQHLGPLVLVEGEWWVGRFVVGGFYVSHGGVFYPATEALRRADGPPLAELGLGRDALNAALDGAQVALAEMTLTLAHSLLHPIRTLEDLGQLPTTLAHLIASSPEYFARYGAMSREDQIREAARLSTHLLLLMGGARATVGRLGGLGAELPVLSVTAEGELVLGGAVVAAGTTATVGLDLSALSILHMAGSSQGNTRSASGKAGKGTKTVPAQGPGKWTYKKPTTESKQALDYQEQVTGRPAWYVYMVGAVEFDGFNGKALLEAKGGSYKNFLTKDGTAQLWFEAGKGFKGLLEQARRQSEAARTLNLPVVWYVAEAEFANFLQKLFEKNGWGNITVHPKPAAR